MNEINTLGPLFTYVDDEQVQSFKDKFLVGANASPKYNDKLVFLGSTGEIATKGKIYGRATSAEAIADIIKDNITFEMNGADLNVLFGETIISSVTLPTSAGDIPCTGITVEHSTLDIEKDGTAKIAAHKSPANSTHPIEFYSSNQEIATVTDLGTVTWVSGGTCTIEVCCGTKSTTVTINCDKLNSTTYSVGEIEQSKSILACDETSIDLAFETVSTEHWSVSGDKETTEIKTLPVELGYNLSNAPIQHIGTTEWEGNDLQYNVLQYQYLLAPYGLEFNGAANGCNIISKESSTKRTLFKLRDINSSTQYKWSSTGALHDKYDLMYIPAKVKRLTLLWDSDYNTLLYNVNLFGRDFKRFYEAGWDYAVGTWVYDLSERTTGSWFGGNVKKSVDSAAAMEALTFESLNPRFMLETYNLWEEFTSITPLYQSNEQTIQGADVYDGYLYQFYDGIGGILKYNLNDLTSEPQFLSTPDSNLLYGSIKFSNIYNYDNSKSETFSTCLKIESATKIEFTTTTEAVFTFIFGDSDVATLKIDGTAYTGTDNILAVTIEPGSHLITRNSSTNLFAIRCSNSSYNWDANDGLSANDKYSYPATANLTNSKGTATYNSGGNRTITTPLVFATGHYEIDGTKYEIVDVIDVENNELVKQYKFPNRKEDIIAAWDFESSKCWLIGYEHSNGSILSDWVIDEYEIESLTDASNTNYTCTDSYSLYNTGNNTLQDCKYDNGIIYIVTGFGGSSNQYGTVWKFDVINKEMIGKSVSEDTTDFESISLLEDSMLVLSSTKAYKVMYRFDCVTNVSVNTLDISAASISELKIKGCTEAENIYASHPEIVTTMNGSDGLYFDGASYFQTEIIPDYTDTIDIKFTIAKQTSQAKTLWCTRNGSSGNSFSAFVINLALRADSGSSLNANQYSLSVDKLYDYSQNVSTGTLILNKIEKNITINQFTPSNKLTIGGSFESVSATTGYGSNVRNFLIDTKLHSFSIKDSSGKYKLYLVPITNNVLIDLVTGTTYSNRGTGNAYMCSSMTLSN